MAGRCAGKVCALIRQLANYESANRTFIVTRKRKKKLYEIAQTFCYESALLAQSVKVKQ